MACFAGSRERPRQSHQFVRRPTRNTSSAIRGAPRRCGVHTDKLAKLLLGHDGEAEIVALVGGGECAVVFEDTERRVVAEQFDAHGFGETEVL